MNRYAFIVPVYNHGATLKTVVDSLSHFGFPVIVVDDGNDLNNKKFIQNVVKENNLVELVERKKNGGKGRAVNDGIRRAHLLGITHAIQIDSDGQHDIDRVEHFIKLAEENPEALICGYPEYDESVPSSRLKARKIANTWVHIVTLSDEIKDAMIGFRVYPVEPYWNLLKHHAVIDSHMGFDIDILVRLVWKGVPLVQSGVKVKYPADGISNFRLVRDNVHISLAYTRLCAGMLVRLPVLIFRKVWRKRK